MVVCDKSGRNEDAWLDYEQQVFHLCNGINALHIGVCRPSTLLEHKYGDQGIQVKGKFCRESFRGRRFLSLSVHLSVHPPPPIPQLRRPISALYLMRLASTLLLQVSRPLCIYFVLSFVVRRRHNQNARTSAESLFPKRHLDFYWQERKDCHVAWVLVPTTEGK